MYRKIITLLIILTLIMQATETSFALRPQSIANEQKHPSGLLQRLVILKNKVFARLLGTKTEADNVNIVQEGPATNNIKPEAIDESGTLGELLRAIEVNKQDAAIDFLKAHGFTELSKETAETFTERTGQLTQQGISGMFINPLTGEFAYGTFTLDNTEMDEYEKTCFSGERLKTVECGLFELIDKPGNDKEQNIWFNNSIPIMGGEIYHSNGTPFSDGELEEAGLRKTIGPDGKHIKVRLFASGNRVVSLPGPWPVPFIKTENGGVTILRTLKDISIAAGREVKRSELGEVILELVNSGKISLKLASDLQFKGVGCYKLGKIKTLTDHIAHLVGQDVYIPEVPYDNRGGINKVHNGGIGAAPESIAYSLTIEQDTRKGGAVFLADTIFVKRLFDRNNMPGLGSLEDYKEAWFSIRLSYGTYRASVYSDYDPEWGYDTRTQLLERLLAELFPDKSTGESMDLFLKLSAYNLAKNIRAFFPKRIVRDWASDISDNYGAFMEAIDTGEGSFEPAVIESGHDMDYAFFSCWIGHSFWLLENIWKKVTGKNLDHYYFKEVFLPVMLGSKELAREFLDDFKFVKYTESSSHDVPFLKLFHLMDYSRSYVDIPSTPNAEIISHEHSALAEIDSAA